MAALLLTANVFAQGGIKFSEGKWNDLLAKAKAQNVLIFVDAYTTWCGPCKMMSNQVFPDAEVGKFYNASFINVKMDMEKGEGIELAKRYNVMAYPTFLFVDGNGQIAHRSAGYRPVEDFIELGETALDPQKRMGGMDTRYSNGDRDPQFLYDYAMARYNAMAGNHVEVAEAYLKTQQNWNTPEIMSLIFYLGDDPESPMFDYLVKNRKDFEETFGADAVEGRLQELVYQKAFAGNKSGEEALKEVDALLAKIMPEEAPKLSAAFHMEYYQNMGDVNNFAKAAVDYFDKYPSMDANELNNIAWAFYENVGDKEMLKKALAWSQKSVNIDNQYAYNDTLAALYFKTGDKKKGKKTAQKAIEIAKKNNEDYSGTTQLLEQWTEKK